MKNLVKLGVILNRMEQKQVQGGGGFGLEYPPDPCTSHEDCWNQTGNFSMRCNARSGRCFIP